MTSAGFSFVSKRRGDGPIAGRYARLDAPPTLTQNKPPIKYAQKRMRHVATASLPLKGDNVFAAPLTGSDKSTIMVGQYSTEFFPDLSASQIKIKIPRKSDQAFSLPADRNLAIFSVIMDVLTLPPPVSRVERRQVELRVKGCARLPSLSTINTALRELLSSDRRYTSQISEVIRRDPSLTARLLRLVNSVYFGLTTPVNSIEEAVFYLGVRQIRQLAMVTPIIEDFQKLAGQTPFAWREFWRHCIGTAIMTREVISLVEVPVDEADYVAGLIHDVGKIAMASAFPNHFAEIHRRMQDGATDLIAVETEVLGHNHSELGGLYLKNHNLPEIMVESALYHHAPELASHHCQIVAAVQIADLLVRHAKIGFSGNPTEVAAEDWLNATGWNILIPERADGERTLALASLNRSLERLPTILEGLI